jgi:hypothetical protein
MVGTLHISLYQLFYLFVCRPSYICAYIVGILRCPQSFLHWNLSVDVAQKYSHIRRIRKRASEADEVNTRRKAASGEKIYAVLMMLIALKLVMA